LLAAFFELLAFFAGALLRAFFAAGAAVLLLAAVLEVVVEAAGADDDEAAPAVLPLDGLDFEALLLGFADPPAAFFFGDAAFFFGLLALPAVFGLAAALDFGLADFAFLAPVDAFFLLAGAVAVADGAAVVVGGLAVVAAATVAGFLADAFFVGEAERFRLLVPLADFGLLDDRAFFCFSTTCFFTSTWCL